MLDLSQNINLFELTSWEWESLCDGCGKCCLVKLEDPETGELCHTSVSCEFLNRETCQCLDYKNRFSIRKGCLKVTPGNIKELDYLPESCAYRVSLRGELLPDWHPLRANSPEPMHQQGHSMKERTVSEKDISDDELLDFIIDLK